MEFYHFASLHVHGRCTEAVASPLFGRVKKCAVHRFQSLHPCAVMTVSCLAMPCPKSVLLAGAILANKCGSGTPLICCSPALLRSLRTSIMAALMFAVGGDACYPGCHRARLFSGSEEVLSQPWPPKAFMSSTSASVRCPVLLPSGSCMPPAQVDPF